MNEDLEKGNIPEELEDQMDFDFSEGLEAEDTATTEEVDTPVETEVEFDYTPLLEKLAKEVKYMDEEVKIENVDFLKNTFQKGLDYDRKTAKLTELENSEEYSYIKDKAKENGMTPKEYIEAVKTFEVNQAKELEENEINDMIDNGIAEDIARKVVETNRIAKDLEKERQKIKDQEKELELAKLKEAENERFLEAYPGINLKEIPKEVFKEAEQTSLIEAYTRFRNQELVKELEILKQNSKNEQTSPVKGTTEHGSKEAEIDPFLMGFNS